MNMGSSDHPSDFFSINDGVLISNEYNDVYHNKIDLYGQAHQIFLGGNNLPNRFRSNTQSLKLDKRPFVILEIGFGAAVNFIITLRAWLNLPHPKLNLHYVGIDKNPFTRDDINYIYSAIFNTCEVCSLLLNKWPNPTPGTHRLNLTFQNQGMVVLDLIYQDACVAVKNWDGHADAIYLDGFSPSKNPELWSEEMCVDLFSCMNFQATLASYSSAGWVRRNLEKAGFVVTKRDGYLIKRNYIVCVKPDNSSLFPFTGIGSISRNAFSKPNRVLVVGAGIAGASIANAIAKRGASVVMVDCHAEPAMLTSGNPAGAFHVHVSSDDSLMSQLSRVGVDATVDCLHRLNARKLIEYGVDWGLDGQIQLATDGLRAKKMKNAISNQLSFQEDVRWLESDVISDNYGISINYGGYHFPNAGWVSPRVWVRALMDESQSMVNWQANCRVDQLDSVIDSFDAIVVCAGNNTQEFLKSSGIVCSKLLMNSVKGQVSIIDTTNLGFVPPRIVLSGLAYSIPFRRNAILIGATYEHDVMDLSVTEKAHHQNLSRWLKIWALEKKIDYFRHQVIGGRSGFRVVTPDRLPMIGEIYSSLLKDDAGYSFKNTRVFIASGFGSKGLTWAAMSGEVIAAKLFNEPNILNNELLQCIDPMRYF